MQIACSAVAHAHAKKAPVVNDATRDTNKLYARQRSCYYHYYHNTGPNRTNSFNKKNDVGLTVLRPSVNFFSRTISRTF